MSGIKSTRTITVLLMGLCLAGICLGKQAKNNWQRKEVNLRASDNMRIRAIYYPPGQEPVLLKQSKNHRKKAYKKPVPQQLNRRREELNTTAGTSLLANVIDTPPLDGFVPWITVITTDKRLLELEIDAVVENSINGNITAANPQTDYAIGLFDTGASSHIMSYEAGEDMRLPALGLLTGNTIEVFGVTGSVEVLVSQPLGVFIDGLGALDEVAPGDPNGILLDMSSMVGQSNVSISVGQDFPLLPPLPTAIGAPMSVYYTTSIITSRPVTRVHNGQVYTAPEINIYEKDDTQIPNYPIAIPLELRPLGTSAVQYIIDIFDFTFTPMVPSIIIGNLSQSLFFVHSVDMTEGTNVAFDKDRFMFDTGAQVTVIGSRIAARLALDPADPSFMVEIQGVTGESEMFPGFYIDSVEIPALGEWLSFTNVPVVLLDVASPEGGTLDGIIGMNLFVEYNMVLRGGGMMLTDDPVLEVQLVDYNIPADIAPGTGDGMVDLLDLYDFAQCWGSVTAGPGWDEECDIAPQTPDGVINIKDLAIVSFHWLQGTGI